MESHSGVGELATGVGPEEIDEEKIKCLVGY